MDQRSSRMAKDRLIRELARLPQQLQPLPPERLQIRPREDYGRRLGRLQRDWLLSLPLPGTAVLALWLTAAQVSAELGGQFWAQWLGRPPCAPAGRHNWR